jgi:peptide/nickel transport system substrate-binding protein
MPRRRLLAVALLTSLAVVVAACAAPAPQQNAAEHSNHLRFVTVYPANTVDAHRVHTAFILNSGTVETLVGLDHETLEVYPWLAEKWETDDAEHWTFTIRDGVTFHNGKPLTAAAVKASLERSIDVNPGVKTALRVASMKATGDRTLSITTDGVYPSLISGLVHFNTVITDVTESAERPPVGTGAFAFESFDPAGAAELVRNTGYWDGQAKLERVTMTANQDANARLLALQAGEADVIYRPSIESLNTITQDENLVAEAVPGTRVYHLLYNYAGANRDLWNNVEFRRGIDALVDRDGIAANVMGGQAKVAYNPFTGDFPFSPPADATAHTFGSEAALQHFAAAGLTVSDGKVTRDGKPIALRLATYVARPELPLIAQVVQDAAKKVGLDVEIHVADNIDEFLPAGDWDLATYSLLTISRGDGGYFMNSAFGIDAAQNHGKLADAQVTALIEKFNAEVDAGKRTAIARQFAELVEDQAFNCYLTIPFETVAYRKGVQGWVTPGNEFEYQMVTKDLALG